MVLQMTASGVALIAFILAFMVAPGLPAFASLLAIGLLGVFVVQAPLCKPLLPLPSNDQLKTLACNAMCLHDRQAETLWALEALTADHAPAIQLSARVLDR